MNFLTAGALKKWTPGYCKTGLDFSRKHKPKEIFRQD